jgi:hypothetical protein
LCPYRRPIHWKRLYHQQRAYRREILLFPTMSVSLSSLPLMASTTGPSIGGILAFSSSAWTGDGSLVRTGEAPPRHGIGEAHPVHGSSGASSRAPSRIAIEAPLLGLPLE